VAHHELLLGKAFQLGIELSPYAESLLVGSAHSPKDFLQYRFGGRKRKGCSFWRFFTYGKTWDTSTEKGMNAHIKTHFYRDLIHTPTGFPRYDVEISYVRGFSLAAITENFIERLQHDDPVLDEYGVHPQHFGRKMLTERYHTRILQNLLFFKGLGLCELDLKNLKSDTLESMILDIPEENPVTTPPFSAYFHTMPKLTLKNVEIVGKLMKEIGDCLAVKENELRRS